MSSSELQRVLTLEVLIAKIHHGSLLGYPFVREKNYPKRETILLNTLRLRGLPMFGP